MRWFVAIALLASVLFSQTAYCDETYVGLKVGPFLPNGKAEGLKDFDPGLYAEGSVGHVFGSNLAIEAGLGYYSSTNSEDDDIWVTVMPITATVKGVIPVGQGNVYAGGGAGIYSATYYYSKPTTGWSYPTDYENDESPAGFHLIAGGDFNITEKFSVGASIKWFSAEAKFEDLPAKLDIGGTTADLELKLKF